MSIIVTQIILPFEENPEKAISLALDKIGISRKDAVYSGIFRESLDLRHGKISKIFSVELALSERKNEISVAENNPFVYVKPEAFMPKPSGSAKLSGSPVVVGFGPAGMFASLVLAENGFKPVVLERGSSMEERDRSVGAFFETGKLDTETNIQFGEGGAGAYSDGKLTTRINDPLCALVLDLFAKHGAPEGVLRLAKPHIGTDLLKNIVVSIRKRIEELGGKVIFNCPMTDFSAKDGKISKIITPKGVFDTECAVFAFGHSARDTVYKLAERNLEISPKAFSVGLRIEHLREAVDYSVYGKNLGKYELPAAEYALSSKELGRGCYSFCMCPGGSVIAAASEENGVVTNGMSLHARNGANSNSALCVSVNPCDFDGAFGGIELQRRLEKQAFLQGGGDYRVPVQCVGDFLSGRLGSEPTTVKPSYPIGWKLTDFSKWLPEFVYKPLCSAIPTFSKKLSCFADENAVLSGIESRTSSPVRVERNSQMQADNVQGLYLCGEGAGYAGGIMSAAVDGIKAASNILARYEGVK